MDFIIFLFIFVHCLFAEEIHLPDGRIFNVPQPEDLPYIIDEYPASLERLYVLSLVHSDAALSCPKNYAILEMSQYLVTNGSYILPDHVVKFHSASLISSERPGRTDTSPCPVLYDCLGYQACLFEFNHQFCPFLPYLVGQSVLLKIVCFRDKTEVVPLKMKNKKNFVLHIYQKHPPLHEQTKLGHIELVEDEVFGRQCSSSQIAMETEGFFGKCSQIPPSVEVTTQQLWSLLGKTISDSCRNHLLQVYCAFQYDNEGFCLPPVYHNKNNKSSEIFSQSALPAARYQPHCNVRQKDFTKPNVFLKPARLAFMIMVNNGYQEAMELISHIYREEFFYVLHVNKQNPDLRQELKQLISQSSFPNHNIYILPEEKSFITPLSSYENVRAQLEGFSELLCYESWDFIINLSDNDIPLRSVDDLAAALSPYVGFSFLSLSQHLTKDDKESTLNSNAFSACDGFVYKVTSKKPASKLDIFRASSRGAFSRDFIAYLVNETMRSKTLNDYQFYLQTESFPDDSYISTMLMNSPYRKSTHFTSLFSTKDIHSKNYLSDFYTCKNHSQLECSGIEEIITLSHSSFFVRFPSEPPPDIRAFSFSLAKGNYYGLLEKYFSPILQKLIVENAIERFCAKAKLPMDHLQVESILKFHIAPSLVPQDPCCESDIFWDYSEITDFTYWIVANLFNRTSGKHIEARLMLESSLQNRFCFNEGDLRMAFISPWIKHLNPSDQQFSRFTPEIVMPLPYGPAFINEILINLVFSTEGINHKCRSDHKGNPILIPMDTKNFTDNITLNLRLISPNYEERCATNFLLNWQNMKMKTESWQQKKRAVVLSFTMRCKNMDPGQWTLQIREMEPLKSGVYRFPLYLLDFKSSNDLASQLKDAANLWDLKRFILITSENSFKVFEPEISDENVHKIPKKKFKISDDQNSANVKIKSRPGDSEFHQWFICTGGFASTFSACLLLVLIYYRKSRFHQNLVWAFMLSLVLVVLLQIALYVTLCGQ